MLSVSSNFTNAMNGTTRNFDIMVKISRNTSGSVNSPIDISDRVISYTTTHDFESRSGRLDLVIDNYDYSLSPLNRTSASNLVAGVYDPLLDSNHKVEVYEGIYTSASVYEYVKKFEGYIGDDITAGSTPQISISCRDKSKLLQDRYIYQGPTYALWLVEQIIQDMINQFAGDLGITLNVQTPTQYMIGRPDIPYTASDTNLWNACQLLADTASQELRFMEDGTLLLRPVIRDWTTLPVNLALDQLSLADDEMQITDADVRNYIVVKVQNFNPVVVYDQASIDKYGRRYMEVTRSVTDLITDASQAYELATNILWDLRFARANETSELPLNPLLQVGDIVTITNPRLGTNTTDDLFKVLTVTNSFAKDSKRTKLVLQGYDKFVSTPDIAPNPPTALASQIQTRSIQNYPNSGWTGYEKETYFPMLTWTPPTKDISGNTLTNSFGGYVIERATQLSGNTLVSGWTWGTIASVPSYISALSANVNYFYDYSSMDISSKYKQAGATGNSITLQYRVSAISNKGSKSAKSNTLSVSISFQKFKDINGNYV